MPARDFERLVEVNARLMRARKEYRTALDAEHKAKQFSHILPESANTLSHNESTQQRIKLAAQEFELAMDEFIKFPDDRPNRFGPRSYSRWC
jgi:hypothetical protein